MWKKGESDEARPSTASGPGSGSAPAARPDKRRPAPQQGERAIIGPSIVIKGDVSGEEDLFVQGRIEGTVNLEQHRVAIGPDGRVKADVRGLTVTIEGEVEGDLRGSEQVILRPSARVRGNIAAPRVILEDGAKFQGSIDMDVDAGSSGASPAEPAPSSRPEPKKADQPAEKDTPARPNPKPDAAG